MQYEKALEIILEHASPTGSSLGLTYTHLGMVYNSQGNSKKALEYLNKSLDSNLTAPAPNQSSLGADYNNIGLIYLDQKRYTEALEMFEKSLKIGLEFLPSNHPDLATTYNNIAAICIEQGSYEKTVEYLNKTLQIQLKSLPPNHSKFAETYHNLSLALLGQGKLQEAVENMRIACRIYSNAVPVDHPHAIVFRERLQQLEGNLSFDQGDYVKAIEYYSSSLELHLQSNPSNYEALGGICFDLSNSYHRRGKLKEALEHAKMSFEFRSKAYPSDHPDVLQSHECVKHLEAEFRQSQAQIN